MADPFDVPIPAPSCAACDHPLHDGDLAVIVQRAVVHHACADAYRRTLAGLVHECPRCNTKGKVRTGRGCRTGKGTRLVEVPVEERCDLCGGQGWLRAKPEPVMGVVDWKVPS